MLFQTASTTLGGFRSGVSSMANTASIGLIGTVGWEEHEVGAGLAEGAAGRLALVPAQVVDDDHVAGFERADETLHGSRIAVARARIL